MAITTMASVKVLMGNYTRTDVTAPTINTIGVVGDILLDTVTGLTYVLSSITTIPGPPDTYEYNWTPDTHEDAKINLLIPKAEADYELIQNKPFDLDDQGDPIYPDGADATAAGMVQYLFSAVGSPVIKSESMGRYSVTVMDNFSVKGYPSSVISGIKRWIRGR